MKRAVLGVFTVLVLVAAAAVVNGQSIVYPLKAKIPFDFIVGDTVLPQGEYIVSTLDANGEVILKGAKESVMCLTMRSGKHRNANADELVFHRLNGEYFLSSIWTAENPDGYQLFASRREREHVAAGNKPEVLAIAASTF